MQLVATMFIAAGFVAYFFYKWTCFRIGRIDPDNPNAVDWGDLLFDATDSEKRRKLTNLRNAAHPRETARLARIALRLEILACILVVIGAVIFALRELVDY